jgi:hypothetical protein
MEDNMRRIRRFAGVAMLLAAMAVPALAGDVSYGASAGVFSRYMWRGIRLSPGAVIQPAVGMGYRGFYAEVWSNINLEDAGWSETDLTISYSQSLVLADLEFGYIYYGVNDVEDSQEIYGKVSFHGPLEPSFAVYADIDSGKGAYFLGSVGHTLSFPGGYELGGHLSVGYNCKDGWMGVKDDGTEMNNFHDGQLSLDGVIPLYKGVTLEPIVAYSFPLTDDAKQSMRNGGVDGGTSTFWGGATLRVEF